MKPSPSTGGERLRRWGMGRFLAAAAIILVYILLLGKVPFLVASVCLILILGTVFRERTFLDALRPSIIAALVVVVVALAISKVFGIMFLDSMGDRWISLASSVVLVDSS